MDHQTTWDTHIRSYLSSGLSVAAYCKKVGITAHQFNYRYNRYRQPQGVSSTTPTERPANFIPVEIKPSALEKANAIEVHFPNGCYCLVSPPFDEPAMSKMIRLLKS